jgi:hypothetical protein
MIEEVYQESGETRRRDNQEGRKVGRNVGKRVKTGMRNN